ncbi:MAG: two-component regulator propeller domain-containing protein, partial [Ignavibacteriaceae bacterium]
THGNGINRYNYSTATFTNFTADGSDGSISGNIIWKILEDNQGLLWIATQGTGFNIFDYNSNKFKRIVLDSSNPQDPSSNNVKDIFEDRASVLWIGMFTGGIKKINRKPSQFSSLKKIPNNTNSLPENFVYTMCEDTYGDIWIGTYSSLTRYLPLKDSFINYPVNQPGENAVSGQRVRYIYRDSHNEIWIGTYFGKLNKYDRSTDSFKKYSLAFNYNAAENSNVRVIYEDSKGYLWIGTNGNGLIKYDRLNNKLKIFDTKSSEISGDIVLSLIEDKKGNLWVGTFGRGLNKLSLEKWTFTHFKSDPDDELSLSDNSVTELFIDSKDNLWIGTFSGGLCRYDYNENNFKTFKEIDGLAGNYVSGILEDEHYNLWISTSKGISRFSPGDSILNNFKNYNFTQGLQKGEFIPGARLKTKNNIMYFGGVNGISYFHPDSLENTNNISPVVITSFKIHNNEVNLSKNIVYSDTILLNYNENYFAFEFASLDYTYPEKNMYAYTLAGLDKNWNYSGSRRFASYTHLDPGEYEFKVKGTNSEGIWNEAGASII